MKKLKASVSTPPTYRELLKAIGDADEQEPNHDVRQSVLQAFKASGGDYNRWNKLDWSKMAESIIRIEDDIELRRSSDNRDAALLTLKQMRRMLEWSNDE